MHACGHDGHIAMLLGAAKILSSHREAIHGTVLLLFERGEENGGGSAISWPIWIAMASVQTPSMGPICPLPWSPGRWGLSLEACLHRHGV